MHIPTALDEVERHYWRGVWRTAVYDAVSEMRIDLARFGPVQAAIVAEEPEEPMLNLILGAGTPGAVEKGHLEDAVEWVASHGVDYRVPVTPGRPAANLAERWLMERGHEQGGCWIKLIRDVSPPAFEPPPGVETLVRDDPNEDESFGDPLAESLSFPGWASTFFLGLPGTEGWRCYVAVDGDRPLACVAMLIHAGVAQLAIAPSPNVRSDRDGQAALLHRCVGDAAAAGCDAIFAEVETPKPGERLSRPAENLFLAGFEQAFVRADWRPPREVIRPERTHRMWWLA